MTLPPKSRAAAPTTLRIIGGKFRGRSLVYSGESHTRPMKDRVRESLFNLLTTEVIGRHAIDLFAGTGALAFEALSRGADSATLIERHIPTAKLIRDNAERLGVREVVQIASMDAFAWLKRLQNGTLAPAPPTVTPWVVFLSPPWAFFQEREADLMAAVRTLLACSPPGSILAVEADTDFDPTKLPEPDDWDVRPYPPALIAIYRLEG
jgi:16S rRNA (guanine966-N2)-methyltransferase